MGDAVFLFAVRFRSNGFFAGIVVFDCSICFETGSDSARCQPGDVFMEYFTLVCLRDSRVANPAPTGGWVAHGQVGAEEHLVGSDLFYEKIDYAPVAIGSNGIEQAVIVIVRNQALRIDAQQPACVAVKCHVVFVVGDIGVIDERFKRAHGFERPHAAEVAFCNSDILFAWLELI